MDQSQTESELSMSPSGILERLHLLRQLQLLQRGKLQKQRLDYQEISQTSTGSTEIVSQFSNSTSYNTFHSSLYPSAETTNDNSARSKLSHMSDVSQKLVDKDMIDGVSILNLSQESEFIATSPLSIRSKSSNNDTQRHINKSMNPTIKKNIELDEMPILSPRKDFETILLEKLQDYKKSNEEELDVNLVKNKKKPFLKRGEGTARFGLKKCDLVIENTKSLPWRRKNKSEKPGPVKTKNILSKPLNNNHLRIDNLQTLVPPSNTLDTEKSKPKPELNNNQSKDATDNSLETVDSSNCKIHSQNQPNAPSPILKKPEGIHPLKVNKGKTWASVFTKEQDDFLRQLKQSDYYRNFSSPVKSTISDISSNESFAKATYQREKAEQDMFDLLENKVTQECFSFESSFLNRFLRKSQIEYSNDSTPLVFQKCLTQNPHLLRIFPEIIQKNKDNTDLGSCNSECECDHETCSSVSTCSTCNTVEEINVSHCTTNSKNNNHKQRSTQLSRKEVKQQDQREHCQDDTVTETDNMKTNIEEMNTKLLATSELLKDRLKELEDEIETFRTENSNLAKLREEVDLERKKFYEEKATFEQKFNEEKILSEYYLAEEKEKLSKQKLMYEKYVREMRGRLNKKEKDEVVKLKQEISELKEDIRIKDAKSTTTIARLRNQLKIMEKEKKNLQDEVAKLEKENRRIHHSNEMTRRLSNIKYLEQINKKLSNIAPKDIRPEISLDKDIKYKAYEIERQSRSRRIETETNRVRPRAKSVPNFNVTSRYAKYFSQRDAVSEFEKNNTENVNVYRYDSEDEVHDNNDYNKGLNLNDSANSATIIDDDDPNEVDVENNLEKLYLERFKSHSPPSSKSSLNNSANSLIDRNENRDVSNGYFLRNSNGHSKSPNQGSASPRLRSSTESTRSRSPVSVVSQRPFPKTNYTSENSTTRPKSPVSILSNRSTGGQKSLATEKANSETNIGSNATSRTSLNKTTMNPIELKKQDGTREFRFPNGNVKFISPDGKYTKFVYYNGDVKENFYDEGRIKYYYAETKTYHTTHPDGLEVLEFSDGQVEKRYKDGSTEIRLPNGSVRYHDPKSEHVREEWRFPDGTTMTVTARGEQRVVFSNGQVEVHAKDHKRREFPDGTVKLLYNDGTAETRYSSGRVRIKDKHGNLIMDSAPG